MCSHLLLLGNRNGREKSKLLSESEPESTIATESLADEGPPRGESRPPLAWVSPDMICRGKLSFQEGRPWVGWDQAGAKISHILKKKRPTH